MSLTELREPNDDVIDRIAAITGFGWTTSLLAFLGTVIGYGGGLVAGQRLLLYLGIVLFVVTLSLDRLGGGR